MTEEWVIETERLLFRRMTQSDASYAAALWGDSEVGYYLTDPYYRDAAELLETLVDFGAKHGDFSFRAFDRKSGDPVGTCSTGAEGRFGEWGIGYVVERRLWGRGYAGEMAQAKLDFARARGVRRFLCTVCTENAASIRVLERLGFARKGVWERTVWKLGTTQRLTLHRYLLKPGKKLKQLGKNPKR